MECLSSDINSKLLTIILIWRLRRTCTNNRQIADTTQT